MNRFIHMLASTVCASAVVLGTANGAAVDLVSVDATTKNQVAAKAGDLVKLSIHFPIVPAAMVSDLTVGLPGPGLKTIAVARVPQLAPNGRPLVGGGEVAAFVQVEKPGVYKVTLTADDHAKSAYEVTINVAPRDE
jgi:hypothetical protein